MNWMRAKLEVEHLRERARDERLREARVVLDQHVPVGQDREQHELELGALADDRPLHLVEHGRRARADLLQGERRSPCAARSARGGRPRRGCRRAWRPRPHAGHRAAAGRPHELPCLRARAPRPRSRDRGRDRSRPSRAGRGRCRAAAGTGARACRRRSRGRCRPGAPSRAGPSGGTARAGLRLRRRCDPRDGRQERHARRPLRPRARTALVAVIRHPRLRWSPRHRPPRPASRGRSDAC